MEFVQARVHSSGDEGWSGTALDLEAFAREEGSILEESPAPFQPEREAAVAPFSCCTLLQRRQALVPTTAAKGLVPTTPASSMDFNSQEAFASVDEQQEMESCACTLLSQVNVARNNEVLLFQD